MREPKWPTGAYSSQPRLLRHGEDGPWRSHAAIECWRGTPEEFIHITATLIGEIQPGNTNFKRAFIATIREDVSRLENLDEMIQVLRQFNLREVAWARIELASPDENSTAILTARPRLPGLEVQVTCKERTRAFEITKKTYRQMMIGYVDRLGQIQSSSLIILGMLPLTLASIVISIDALPLLARILFLLTLAACGLLVMDRYYERLLVSQPFVLTSSPEPFLGRIMGRASQSIRRAFDKLRRGR
ncbi:hypothetical protein [Actinomadura rudentiformis]|uniref:Uncharacterized protein n=1 Tax=Actinomadura rudentiformis TaxID=359158 RepID=A0A6H9YA89_9ACTN|nr:hypothetical protein [Actinomadura rudentiformis]KAB2341528.1 hypothetical protein F8566_41015 [Actinomadura rudentiformis]